MPDAGQAAAVFAQSRPGTEAVTQRIGARSTQVILVAPSGEWQRVVVASLEEAATDLWRIDWLREMGAEAAAELWLEPVRFGSSGGIV